MSLPEFVGFPSIARLSRSFVVTEKPRARRKRVLTPEQKASSAARVKRWVAANRERLNANVRAYRKRRYEQEGAWRETAPKVIAVRAWIAELKAAPCSDCGGRFEACCMDFDHRVGEMKSNNVGSMVAHHYAREIIEVEVAKCDLVCSNCHRIRTRDRRRGSGTGGRGR